MARKIKNKRDAVSMKAIENLLSKHSAVVIGAVDKKFQSVDKRFDAVDRRFDAVDKKFQFVDRRFDAVDKRIDNLERKLETEIEDVRADFRILAKAVDAYMKQGEKFYQETVALSAKVDRHER